MYGITGTMDPEPTDAERLKSVVTRMADALCHQGSTDSEIWVDAENGLALGFSGTPKVGPSPLARGSMVSTIGRYVVTFNGQIYNSRTRTPTGAGRSVTQRIVGHRDCPSRCRRVGHWSCRPPFHWGFRNGVMGFAQTVPHLGPRPPRRQAPVLRLGKESLGLCVRTKGAPCSPRDLYSSGSRGACLILTPFIHTRTTVHIRGSAEAARRMPAGDPV